MRVKVDIDMRSGIRKVGKWGIESLKMREINSHTTGGFTCIPVEYILFMNLKHIFQIYSNMKLLPIKKQRNNLPQKQTYRLYLILKSYSNYQCAFWNNKNNLRLVNNIGGLKWMMKMRQINFILNW